VGQTIVFCGLPWCQIELKVPASNKLGDRLIAAAQVAGVLATAWIVWVNHVLPRLGFQSVARMFVQALVYVTLAWICGGVVTFWVYFVVSLADLPRATHFSLRTSAPAMWYAPAIVLLSVPVAGSFAFGLFLVANATRQLISQWGVIQSPVLRADPVRLEQAAMFALPPPDTASLSWSFLPVLMGSLTAQAGLVALLWRYPFRAAALLALSTAILTSLSIATGAYRPVAAPALPHSALSVVMTFLLAAALTFGGVSVRGARGAGPDAATSAAGSGGPSAVPLPPDLPTPPDETMGPGGDFPGVILLPELQPHATLVAPSPSPVVKFGAPLATPVGIPFTGQYWMFRWPAERPPRRSIIRRGDASEISFHTTDGMRLEMEAHQKLDPPISVHCCSQIQLAIQDADPYPGTVSLELVLIDTTVPINLTQSLGSVPPAGQILSFRIPPVTALQKFDEIKVVFHRDRIRADKSARIAIQRLILMP
jgi:hypothetical protein